jgi:hypothetical protein
MRDNIVVAIGILCLLVPAARAQSHAADKAFTDCLAAEAPKGGYSSSDGGKSAVVLMDHCQWAADRLTATATALAPGADHCSRTDLARCLFQAHQSGVLSTRAKAKTSAGED